MTEPAAPPAPDPSTRRSRAFVVAALLAIFGLALGVRMHGFTDPFGDVGDLHTIFGAGCTGGRARALADHGIAEARFMPYDWRVEYDDGGVHRPYYTHHPPLYMFLVAWAIRAFGPEEWVVRLVPLLFSLLALWGVWLLARELFGTRVALFATWLAAVYPLAARAGMIAWTEAPIAAFIAFAARRYWWWLEGRGRGHLVATAVWVAIGGLFDWPMAFAAGALFLHGLIFARGAAREDRRRLWWLPAASIATVVLHRLHMAAILPHDFAQQEKAITLGDAMRLHLDVGQFLGLQWRYLVKQFTPVGLATIGAAFLGALVLALRGRISSRTALVAALLVPGVLYVALFPGRSHNHDFFLMVSLAGFAIAGAVALDGLVRSVRIPWVGTAAAVAVALWTTWMGITHVRVERIVRFVGAQDLVALVDAPEIAELLADRDAVVMTHFGRGQLLLLYSSAPIVWAIDDVNLFDDLHREFTARIAPPRRIVYLVEHQSFPFLLERGPPLAARLAQFGAPREVTTARGLRYSLFDLRGGGA